MKRVALLAASVLIANATLAQANPPPAPQAALTAEQLAKVRAVLSKYKPDALTTDDAKALKRGLRDAGFQPGPALDAAIASSGFSIHRLDALDPRPAGSAPAR
ncbi:hypothetical protein [Piscinibacter terrae]|uniref:hypothetical protein n=1 Tax=Piscinibacter terrae TaxID=2496871 RepID=UPI001C105BF3|nr:hypothetical protein [Albitalea terrae]